MDKISVAIISANKRLRFAYKMLLSENADSRMDVLFEGPSLQDISVSAKQEAEPYAILLDDMQVYKNKALYFSFLRKTFPHSRILLIVSDGANSLKGDVKNFVHGIIHKSCSSEALVSAISHLDPPSEEFA